MEPKPRRKPILLVVSGPSGSGKDSVIAALRTLEPRIGYCVSTTTRSPRPGEIEGVHYHFVSRDRFETMAEAGEFLETREYAGNLYGAPKIKQLYPEAVLVFLTVRSEEELMRRLEGREADGPDDIAARMETARVETKAIKDYEYLIINDEFDVAVAQLRAILMAESLRVSRL